MRSAGNQRRHADFDNLLTFSLRSAESWQEALHTTDRMVDELNSFTEPSLLFLIVQFVQAAIL